MRSILLALALLLSIPQLSWAAAAHRSDSATTYASRTNTTCTAPAGIVDGDVLLMVFDIAAATSAPTPTPPAGFSAATGTYPINILDGLSSFNVDLYIWYKIASGESGNYTVTHVAANSQCYMAAISGGLSSQPVSTQNLGTGTGGSLALSVTPVADSSLVIYVSSDWGSTTNVLSPPAGTTPTFTTRLTPGTVSGLLYVADGVLSPAGATGNKTITNNNSNTGDGWGAAMVVIEAAVGASPATFGFRKRLQP